LPFFATLGHAGFYALLVSAGYQPRFFDLEQVTDAQLAGYRAAVLPTKGYLDAESLAKVRRYVEQGGQLITLPGSIRQDAYGHPLADAKALYPYAEQGLRWLGASHMLAGLVSDWLIRYRLLERRRLARSMPTALHLSDLIEPLLVGQAIKLPAARLTSAGGVGVRGDYQLARFGSLSNLPAEQLVLRSGSKVAGYRVPVGQGTSTVLGTLPGGSYATSVYYRLDPAERAGLRRFAVELLDMAGIQRQAMSDLEIEVVRRRLPDGSWLLFLLNRLGEQHGELRLALEGLVDFEVEVLYRSKHSSAARRSSGSLSLMLAPDDVLVLHLLPA
jgi:hypothetical protein